jgi:hypothetical protein
MRPFTTGAKSAGRRRRHKSILFPEITGAQQPAASLQAEVNVILLFKTNERMQEKYRGLSL